MPELPVACTLSPEALTTRRQGMLAELLRVAEAREELASGHRLLFTASDETLTLLARTVAAERHCCQFLQFQITVQPGDGPITLELTGARGDTRVSVSVVRSVISNLVSFVHRRTPGDRRLLCFLGLASPRAIRRVRSARHQGLCGFAFALTRVDSAFAGRAYAAYGGIEFTPSKSGEIAFACGMNMLHGTIVVQ